MLEAVTTTLSWDPTTKDSEASAHRFLSPQCLVITSCLHTLPPDTTPSLTEPLVAVPLREETTFKSVKRTDKMPETAQLNIWVQYANKVQVLLF
jgi:hypothetical protein